MSVPQKGLPGHNAVMGTADKYERSALECELMAQRATSELQREDWLRLSEEWRKMAAELREEAACPEPVV